MSCFKAGFKPFFVVRELCYSALETELQINIISPKALIYQIFFNNDFSKIRVKPSLLSNEPCVLIFHNYQNTRGKTCENEIRGFDPSLPVRVSTSGIFLFISLLRRGEDLENEYSLHIPLKSVPHRYLFRQYCYK